MDFESGDFAYQNAEEGKPTGAASPAPASTKPIYVPPPPELLPLQQPASAQVSTTPPGHDTSAAVEAPGDEKLTDLETRNQRQGGNEMLNVIHELD